MKSDIHPDYAPIVFRDLASGETFLTRSTATSDKTIELDGETYPVIDVEISSASHPFYTGKQRILTLPAASRSSTRATRRSTSSKPLSSRDGRRAEAGRPFPVSVDLLVRQSVHGQPPRCCSLPWCCSRSCCP